MITTTEGFIAASWGAFVRNVPSLSPGTCAGQCESEVLRLAFYAGAIAVMTLNEIIGEGAVGEEEGIMLLVEAKQELEAYKGAI